MNLSKKFDEYIYGRENFSLRFERFCEDVIHARTEDKIDFAIMLKWLEAAYRVGAEDMANEMVNLPDTSKESMLKFIEEALKK
jgi:hypothetical protein